jgi:hypothetical protein
MQKEKKIRLTDKLRKWSPPQIKLKKKYKKQQQTVQVIIAQR